MQDEVATDVGRESEYHYLNYRELKTIKQTGTSYSMHKDCPFDPAMQAAVIDTLVVSNPGSRCGSLSTGRLTVNARSPCASHSSETPAVLPQGSEAHPSLAIGRAVAVRSVENQTIASTLPLVGPGLSHVNFHAHPAFSDWRMSMFDCPGVEAVRVAAAWAELRAESIAPRATSCGALFGPHLQGSFTSSSGVVDLADLHSTVLFRGWPYRQARRFHII
jgi:hypothetical protein